MIRFTVFCLPFFFTVLTIVFRDSGKERPARTYLGTSHRVCRVGQGNPEMPRDPLRSETRRKR